MFELVISNDSVVTLFITFRLIWLAASDPEPAWIFTGSALGASEPSKSFCPLNSREPVNRSISFWMWVISWLKVCLWESFRVPLLDWIASYLPRLTKSETPASAPSAMRVKFAPVSILLTTWVSELISERNWVKSALAEASTYWIDHCLRPNRNIIDTHSTDLRAKRSICIN